MSKHTPKPCELFPGAVVLYNGKPATWFTWDTVDSHDLIQGDIVRDVRTKELSPLPISPAVLRGLGFQQDEYGLFRLGNLSVRYSRADAEWCATMYQRGFASPKFAHQLQALSLHLYGVELTWNQDEYEKAMKEDAK